MATLDERECPPCRDGHTASRSPKAHTLKIGGLTDSESEYPSDPEEQLDDLIQYSKQVESNSAKNLKFDQDFHRFMNGLKNFEPFDDLEERSDNAELFMDAMASPPKHTDALWKMAKLKKGKTKAPEQSSDSIYDKPWIKEPEGLTPTQSWLHWMNENALRVEMV